MGKGSVLESGLPLTTDVQQNAADLSLACVFGGGVLVGPFSHFVLQHKEHCLFLPPLGAHLGLLRARRPGGEEVAQLVLADLLK